MTYETREAWLNAFIDEARPVFEANGFPIPVNTRVSIGYPTTGARGKVIAQIIHHKASGDGHYEIFVSPVNADEIAVAAALTHEACHAACGLEAGHGPVFGKLARALGLDGKLTATTAGAEWFAWAAPILATLGDMPYAAINLAEGRIMRRKKATFLKKAHCTDCGFIARVTMAHVTPHTHLNCPVPDCDGILTIEA